MAEKKILFVLPPRDFDDHSYETARRIWEGRGHKVFVTSVARGAVTSEAGMSVPVDINPKEIKTYNYDAVVFIGGEGARLYFDDERIRKLAKDMKYKTVGATGNATVILALSEVLKGKKATCPTDWADLLIREGAEFTGRPFEVDDKLITLQDSSAIEHFANAFAKALEK